MRNEIEIILVSILITFGALFFAKNLQKSWLNTNEVIIQMNKE